MIFDVFISHSKHDKTAADAACAALEAAGVRCWIAPRDVEPGAQWAASIMGAIKQCRVMVLIYSGNANGSNQVQREVQNAFDRNVPVIPLRLENVAPEGNLEFYMGSVHWLDALTPPLEQHLARLTQTVTGMLRSAPARRDGVARTEKAIGAADSSAQRNPRGAGRFGRQVSRASPAVSCPECSQRRATSLHQLCGQGLGHRR